MQNLPREKTVGELEQVHAFHRAMPTGVTVSETGRIFMCYPDWGDKRDFSVSEIVDGEEKAYPNTNVNAMSGGSPAERFISVQSVVADGTGILWVLDTAAPSFSKPLEGGAKLVAVDLKTDTVKRTYQFPDDVVLETTYLNDVRVDYRAGKGGIAYITDSSIYGPGGIIVVDLDSGKSWRRLNGDKTTMPDKSFLGKVEGRVLMNRPADGKPTPVLLGTDGIALSPDGKTLYYCPLSSRHLYSIATKMILDDSVPEDKLGEHVKDWGEKGASDGLMTDANGIVYAGDYENNGIRAIKPDGTMETVVHDPRALWPDTLSIGPDGNLYFTANQLHRQAGYSGGKDYREKPYSLFRVKIGAGPAPSK
ncbi:MAG: major royal jelly family protein [Planctomycetaceae bacterium]|nr:major royal jelly family protein [Planctomycetaceae bacterium]